MKFLLVDDSRTMRTIQKKVLGALPGAEFVEAADGVEALALIGAGGTFDVGLIDWNMPNMDGLTLVKRIREGNRTSALIMCTTEAEKSRILEALKAGVNNYVVKPFTPEMLVEKVQATMKKLKDAA